TAHCPNSGSMLSVDTPGADVWLSRADKPDRVLAYTWELIRIGPALVGINTGWPNRLVEEAIAERRLPDLDGYASLRREVRYGRNSRIDLLLESPGRPTCFVEVKNVTLKRGSGRDEPVAFPDAVTVRGTKHLAELAEVVRQGGRAVMLFVTQRADAERLTFAADIDSSYARAVQSAEQAGVTLLCYRCRVAVDGIGLADAIPITSPTPAPD
ncbi:MAG TPA: DNA/RNA nuclease SfsA, partial [Rhodospirillales bacterium]|nr:DNA/RNA nuclease SfsA [Rhodospirillales bacterium]